MGNHVCPVECAFGLDNWLRKLVHNPRRIFGEYVHEGATVADIGCGPGTFTVDLARKVGPTGAVHAIDLHDEMLQRATAKARSAGLDDRIHFGKCAADSIGLDTLVDFALAFWMVHEAPNRTRFLTEIRDALKPGGRFLMVEPRFHVSRASFAETVDIARQVGLAEKSCRKVALSRAALFGV